MPKLKLSNLKKAYRYLKKNGLMSTYYACLERLQRDEKYEKRTLSEKELLEQREQSWESEELFSILVPAYETKRMHFHEMIDSLLCQTYPHWELIIADASPTDKLKEEVSYYNDERIRYIRLQENNGISENTNCALAEAKGTYIGLLDHDDVLEPDALYRMMDQIQMAKKEKIDLQMLYSDEDKCNGEMSEYYEPHYKCDFNLDLLLSNNYICHFLVMKAELMKQLRFRKEYDGAQDHDLVLRAAGVLLENEKQICHVPYVLYHWRCHTGSTAENPESKLYAYEAGRRAVEAFCDSMNWNVKVCHTKHLGFFRVEYYGNPLAMRTDLAAIGGSLAKSGKICGGAMNEQGNVLYENMNLNYSGYMHRAKLQQDVFAVDVRNLAVKEEFQPILDEIKKEENDPVKQSLLFGKEIRDRGLRIMWDPMFGN